MIKQNPTKYARCLNAEKMLYYLHDGLTDILIRLIDYNIHIYNASHNAWFDTGYMVTPQANQTRSIIRAWDTYLKRIYGNNNQEICISWKELG